MELKERATWCIILITFNNKMAASSSTKREVVQFTSYSRKLKDNVRSIMDNYGEILKAAKVNYKLS